MTEKSTVAGLVAVACALSVLLFFARRTERLQVADATVVRKRPVAAEVGRTVRADGLRTDVCTVLDDGTQMEGAATGNGDGVETENSSNADDVVTSAVRAFVRETDRWVRESPVSTHDVCEFSRRFSEVPPSRKMECLRRALNLIPDANVSLLAGILFDKAQPREVLKATFNDIVNRSEEAKEPIVKAVYLDKTHPCCDDATWIYEVTGEKPK